MLAGMNTTPLILITNDDGIEARGLWAAVEAALPLGEVVVVAPDRQWSGAGRSMPREVTGALHRADRQLNGRTVVAYAVDGAPAQVVIHALVELGYRPDLVIAGINNGENLSTEVTVSGTVGAALEAATHGVPALAVSLEMPISAHLADSNALDYTAAIAFTRRLAQRVLARALPFDVDTLNINVPAAATPDTPWQLTFLSRQRYFIPLPPDRSNGDSRPGYTHLPDPAATERGSDVWTVRVAQQISVTPLSLDLTSRMDFGAIADMLADEGEF